MHEKGCSPFVRSILTTAGQALVVADVANADRVYFRAMSAVVRGRNGSPGILESWVS